MIRTNCLTVCPLFAFLIFDVCGKKHPQRVVEEILRHLRWGKSECFVGFNKSSGSAEFLPPTEHRETRWCVCARRFQAAQSRDPFRFAPKAGLKGSALGWFFVLVSFLLSSYLFDDFWWSWCEVNEPFLPLPASALYSCHLCSFINHLHTGRAYSRTQISKNATDLGDFLRRKKPCSVWELKWGHRNPVEVEMLKNTDGHRKGWIHSR